MEKFDDFHGDELHGIFESARSPVRPSSESCLLPDAFLMIASSKTIKLFIRRDQTRFASPRSSTSPQHLFSRYQLFFLSLSV